MAPKDLTVNDGPRGRRPARVECDGSMIAHAESGEAMFVSAGSTSVLDDDFWVFGYGSLMWRPGFAFSDRRIAVVSGFRRRLCIYSHHYRGTRERPGLVLGLDEGGSCAGVAFRVDAALREPTLIYLRERELLTDVYFERQVRATLEGGESIKAIAYVADIGHSQYAPPMDRERLLDLVRQGVGQSGDNSEYVLNTRDHLYELGIADPELEWLAGRLRDCETEHHVSAGA